MFIGIMLAFAQIVSAQWTPIEGFQENLAGNFNFYSDDKQNAIDMCMEVLKVNNVDMSTVDVSKHKDPLINMHLTKQEQPDMVYWVYLVKTTSGYVVRLKFIKDEYTEFEEDFVTIYYESEE